MTEGYAFACDRKVIVKPTIELVREKVVSLIVAFEDSEYARELLAQAQDRSTTFQHIGEFMKANKKLIERQRVEHQAWKLNDEQNALHGVRPDEIEE